MLDCSEEGLLLFMANVYFLPASIYYCAPQNKAYAVYLWHCDAPSGGRPLLIVAGHAMQSVGQVRSGGESSASLSDTLMIAATSGQTSGRM